MLRCCTAQARHQTLPARLSCRLDTVRPFHSRILQVLLVADVPLVKLGEFAEAYAKAKAFVAGLTNAEKVSIITGSDVDSSNGSSWTALANKDGFAGINYQYYVSGFPMGNALAMTWDKDYFDAEAYASGREFYLMGYNLINGPEAGPLGRTPWGGRQAEAFSPDPYLSGVALAKTISGMNRAGVIAGGRHYLLNEQETNRTTGTSDTTSAVYSSNADEKVCTWQPLFFREGH